jgi:ATP-dependent Clp protease protease subunit
MIHQPLGGAEGQASDIEIQAREILWLKQRLYDILAHHTGKTTEQIEEDADRNYWLSAQESADYGLVDKVLVPKKGFPSSLTNGQANGEADTPDEAASGDGA